jgi:PAS domain S-box-containing protein
MDLCSDELGNRPYMGVLAVNKSNDVVYVNKVAEHLLSVAPMKFFGRPLEYIIKLPHINEVLRSGKPCFNDYVEFSNKNFMINTVPISKEGRVLGAVVLLQDVKQNEMSSLSSKELDYRDILDSYPEALLIADLDGKIIRVNVAWEHLWGEKSDCLKDMYLQDIIRNKNMAPYNLVRIAKEKYNLSFSFNKQTGKRLIITIAPLNRSVGANRVIVYCRDLQELLEFNEQLQKQEIKSISQEPLIGSSIKTDLVVRNEQMLQVINLAEKVAKVDSNVLIQGESGVGKDLIAKLIHEYSKRAGQRFIKVNCSAIPDNLLESELFGYEGGAFTGARFTGKLGLLELANGGSFFLDEIGEFPLNMQAKLLQALQDRELYRVGGTKPVHLDVRIIAATNQDLDEMVSEGTFRKDLYYRLNVVPIHVPPLRERQDEIPLLSSHFLEQFKAKYGLDKEISSEAMNYLINYEWPGNVRELQNVIERLVVTVEESVIQPSQLPQYIKLPYQRASVVVPDLMKLKDAVAEVELQLLQKAFSKYQNTYKIAKVLGVNQSTVVRKMQKYRIHDQEVPDANRH